MHDFFSLPQIVGYIALVIYITGYSFKNDNTLKIIFSLSNAVWIVHYHLIGVDTPAMTTFLCLCRNLLSINAETFSLRRKQLTSGGICALLIAAGIVSWSGLLSLVPVLSAIVSTNAMLYKSGMAFRKILIGLDAVWLVYAAIIGSVGGVIYGIFALIVNTMTILRIKDEPPAGPAM